MVFISCNVNFYHIFYYSNADVAFFQHDSLEFR